MTSTKRERQDGEWEELEEHSATQPKKLREGAVTSTPPDTDRQKDDDSDSAEGSTQLLRRAQYWYYQDASQQLQGPFNPADMREWLTAGYFDGSQMVAPVSGLSLYCDWCEYALLWHPSTGMLC